MIVKLNILQSLLNLGEKLDVIVMEQDNENRRLALSHKDLIIKENKKVKKENKKVVKDKKESKTKK